MVSEDEEKEKKGVVMETIEEGNLVEQKRKRGRVYMRLRMARVLSVRQASRHHSSCLSVAWFDLLKGTSFFVHLISLLQALRYNNLNGGGAML